MPSQFMQKYLMELAGVLNAVRPEEFEQFIDVLRAAYERQKQIFIFGNGGSGSTASHFACDFNKGVSYGKDRRFKIICLNDNVPTMLAYANDVSYEDIFVEQLKNFLAPGDVVIGVSGSGNSGNVLRAVEYANQQGAVTYGICGYGGGKLKQAAAKSLVVRSNDMQKVEDAHYVILHCAMQYFCQADIDEGKTRANVLK